MYYVYLLKSEKNNRIYIGSTNNLKKRIKEHNKGKVFSTKYYLPWRLIYYEAYDKESLARLREKRLKYNGNALRELKKRLNFLPLKSGAGFTLTEILVVIFIISLLSALTFANYRQGGKEMALQRSASELAQAIRRAQEMAISASECRVCNPVQIPPAYGIYSPSAADLPTSTKIFADIDKDGKFSPSQDKEIETVYYEQGVNFSSLNVTGCDLSGISFGRRRVHITFKPPDPEIQLIVGWPTGTEYATCSEIIMTLRFGGAGGPTKSVRINKAGLIEIQ
jgi:putative endonuclease